MILEQAARVCQEPESRLRFLAQKMLKTGFPAASAAADAEVTLVSPVPPGSPIRGVLRRLVMQPNSCPADGAAPSRHVLNWRVATEADLCRHSAARQVLRTRLRVTLVSHERLAMLLPRVRKLYR